VGASATVRREKDLIGERDVPAAAYFGVHTLRAMENFAITGIPIARHPELIRALAAVKQAAARANADLHLLDRHKADAICAACEDIQAGRLRGEFRVDVIQGGAGTSTNMNVNEVIANRALEHLGRERGEYAFLHPVDHVNLSQSTNDVYPTALRIALHWLIHELIGAVAVLRASFEQKAVEFGDAITVGRTQLQDAVPIMLGEIFLASAVTLGKDERRLEEAARLLTEINLGATAIGTAVNSHPGYAERAREHLVEITGIELTTAGHLVEATQDTGALVNVSSVLKGLALKLSKICIDLRLLSSGPRAGFAEIQLPAVQAGSSMMPGKVNPVIPEVVNQVAFEVLGNDVTISFAAENGQLQLNAFEPIIAHRLFEGIEHLRAAVLTLAKKCVEGITADRERLRGGVERSIGLVTTLTPIIGYERATQLAQEALKTDRGVYELAHEKGWLTPSQLADALSSCPTRVARDPNPHDRIQPGARDHDAGTLPGATTTSKPPASSASVPELRPSTSAGSTPATV
jgi:aspartate ammonia-lyase